MDGNPATVPETGDPATAVARALAASEARLAAVLDASPDAILIWDQTNGIVLANTAAEALTGYPRDQLLTSGVLERIVHPDDRRFMLQAAAARLEGHDAPTSYTIRAFRADGEERRFQVNARAVAEPEGGRVLIVVRDVTGAQEAEAALQTSEERLRTMIEVMPIGVLVMRGPDVEQLNEAAATITGYSRETLMEPGAVFSIIHPEDVEVIRHRIAARIAGRDIPDRYNIRLYRADGDERTISLTTTVLDHEPVPAILVSALDVTEQQRAQETLELSEARFSTIFRASPLAMSLSLLSSGHFVDVNDAFTALSGVSRQDLVGKSPGDLPLFPTLFHAPGAEVALFRPLYESGALGPVEIPWRTAAGETRETLAVLRRISIDGSPYALGTFLDITARKENERALERSEQRWRRAFQALPVAAALFRFRDGVVLDVNPQAEALMGLTADRMRGRPFADMGYFHEPVVRGSVLSMAREGRPVRNLQTSMADAQGTMHEVLFSAELVDIGDEQCVLGLYHDITELQRQHMAVARSEGRWRQAFAASPVATAIVGCDDYCFVDINPAFEDLTGFAAAELVSHPPSEAGLPVDLRALRGDLERHRSGPHVGEVAMATRRGEVHVMLSAELVEFEGEPEGALLLLLDDLTELRLAEEERRKLESQMLQAQKLESLGVLAGGIAHDFNNLLMAILGNADLALGALESASPARRNIEDIETTARRAAELTRELLAYSGRGSQVREFVNLSALVGEMAHLIEVSISRNATLNYRFDPGLPPVKADATQLRQIVLNLLTNASDAIGDTPGTIAVTTGTATVTPDDLANGYLGESLEPGEYVYFEVADTGCGMDTETLTKIFDPFFTTKFAGRGLGLAAVIGIVRSHGGSIRVASAPGKGSTFRVLLPVANGEAHAGASPAATDAAALAPGATILVIDDDPVVVTVTVKMLEKAGLRVLAAASGDEGIALAREDPGISMVLLDITMPSKDGRQTFVELRGVAPALPIVLTSGYSEHDSLGISGGIDPAGFLQKPYGSDELLACLRGVLGE